MKKPRLILLALASVLTLATGMLLTACKTNETEKVYKDIGDGHFLLDQDVYYVVAGRRIPFVGRYDFDTSASPKYTVTSSDPDAIAVAADGTVTAAKAGDFTLTVREEIYGTSATARLVVVGDITQNIMVSVPVWRGKWVNEEQFGYMRDAGVDMVVAVSGVETQTWDVSMNMLDVALNTWHDGRGLFVLAHSTKDMLENVLKARDKELERLVARFADKPAFVGYHIIDEPYECSPYTAVQRKLGVLDPLALTDVNFLPNGAYASMVDYQHRLDDYCRLLGTESNAYLSFDNYPFPVGKGSVNEGALFGNFEAVRKAGLDTRTRTAFYVQAVGGFNNSYRRPDQATLTYHTASALAYGFKWIKYWSWFVPDYGNPEETYNDYTDAIIGKDGKPTDLYPVACDLHTRVHAIGPVLVNCEADEVYHTGTRSNAKVYTKLPADFFAQPVGNEHAILSLLCDRSTGRQYLMVVNKNLSKAADMSFTLSGVDKVTLYDTRTGTGTETALNEQVLELHLEAGDFAFIGLPEGDFRTETPASQNLAASDMVKITADESQGRDGCFVVCALDGKRTSDADSYAWRVPAGKVGAMLFNFDQPMTVNRLDLYPAGSGNAFGSSFPKSVRIMAETADGWVEVYANDAMNRPTVEVPVIRFQDVTATSLKLIVSNGSMAADLAEVEVYFDDGSIPAPGSTSYEEVTQEKGENVALHKTPIASGSAYESPYDGWGLAYLTDGFKLCSEAEGTNGWMAQGVSSLIPKEGTVWGGVDLGADYMINRIVVYPRQNGSFFPSAYDIQISTDGETWTTVYSEDNDTVTTGEGRTFTLSETVTARFVRISARKLRSSHEPSLGGYLMQVSEIEVFWD